MHQKELEGMGVSETGRDEGEKEQRSKLGKEYGRTKMRDACDLMASSPHATALPFLLSAEHNSQT